jgi:hypothetical protein
MNHVLTQSKPPDMSGSMTVRIFSEVKQGRDRRPAAMQLIAADHSFGGCAGRFLNVTLQVG